MVMLRALLVVLGLATATAWCVRAPLSSSRRSLAHVRMEEPALTPEEEAKARWLAKQSGGRNTQAPTEQSSMTPEEEAKAKWLAKQSGGYQQAMEARKAQAPDLAWRPQPQAAAYEQDEAAAAAAAASTELQGIVTPTTDVAAAAEAAIGEEAKGIVTPTTDVAAMTEEEVAE